MARVIGDTKKTGNYLRVCTEATKSQVIIKGFASLRNADGRELAVPEGELDTLIELLQRAKFSMGDKPVKRDTPRKTKKVRAKKAKKTSVTKIKEQPIGAPSATGLPQERMPVPE